MAYQHTPANGPLLTVEQARRRNAELMIELRSLEAQQEALTARVAAEKAKLEQDTEQARKELTQAYRRLRSKVRELDAVRASEENITKTAAYVSELPPPLYGGRDGLEAAADEMAEYEARRNGRKAPPRGKRVKAELKPALHGTSTAYRRDKCRCAECKAWLSRTSAKHYRNRVERQERHLQAVAA